LGVFNRQLHAINLSATSVELNKTLNLTLIAILIALFVFGREGSKRQSGPGTTPPVVDAQRFPSAGGPRRQPGLPFMSQSCSASGASCESLDFAVWVQPADGSCHTRMSNGYPLPDPHCTPGGINPSVSISVLKNANWTTRCARNCWTSEADKHFSYRWYGIRKPSVNSDENQICELDHLVPLELGGSDALANIWPQCGPGSMVLTQPYFRVKDQVERYLATEVRSGRMDLAVAQRKIAEDWTQFISESNRATRAHD
jgi:hypothetical protein